ncbi:hypothetical protein [Aureivirga sp. CE67]|uniref:hypothetical protein n=1 Tax=Aureivirga sp. CE67 TaxID=1788983 RepID=UPI0018CB5B9D|nr:hypothetical protein [Aureivirga sp. CE67]
MKKILLLFIGFLFIQCTDDPETYFYNVSILNNSNKNLNIKSYHKGNLISNIDLNTSQSGLECSYSAESFIGYKLTQCQIDSIIFKFENGKGYISSINYLSDLNFSNDTNPFGFSSKFVLDNNIYQFIITSEDFENAYNLP